MNELPITEAVESIVKPYEIILNDDHYHEIIGEGWGSLFYKLNKNDRT